MRLWIFAFGLDLLFLAQLSLVAFLCLGSPARPHPHFLLSLAITLRLLLLGSVILQCLVLLVAIQVFRLPALVLILLLLPLMFLALVLVLALVLIPLLEFSNFRSSI